MTSPKWLPLGLSCCVAVGCAQGGAVPRALSPNVARLSGSTCALTIYIFGGQPDGGQPWGPLVAYKGLLYGTTMTGGENNLGSVFSITPSGSEKVLYSFSGSDGEYPEGGLALIEGVLYGTTTAGGRNGQGTLFSITTSGDEKVLYSFAGGKDGAAPSAAPIRVGSFLYGTTASGGSGGDGTIYRFGVFGKGGERVLYAFKGGSDGAQPESSLIRYDNAFYGTTYSGGANGYGTTFMLDNSNVETVLHHFKGGTYEGAHPVGALTVVGKQFFGTTEYGGSANDGTVYKMYSGGHITLVYTFGVKKDDGINPASGLMLADNGLMYGTTLGDVTYGSGTLYSISTLGTESIIAVFDGSPSDPPGCPSMPEAGVTAIGDVLYGTSSSVTGESGAGTVYAVKL